MTSSKVDFSFYINSSSLKVILKILRVVLLESP